FTCYIGFLYLLQVNNENVVKVGHRQVVNMIRQGGNHLVLKVVTVTRNLDPDDTARKKAPPPPKRAPTTALTLRSKSMTSELEDLVDKASMRKKKDKTDEVTSSFKPSRGSENTAVDSRVATIKQRPSSRCFPATADLNSTFDRQGIPVMPPTVPGSPKPPYLGLPRGTVRRQKSIGITEEEKQFLAPPMLKFTRSLSMPDTSEDIPPPPATSPPSPPYSAPPKSPTPTRSYGTIRPSNNQNSGSKSPTPNRSENIGTIRRDKGVFYRQDSEHFSLDSEETYKQNISSQQNLRNRRAPLPENPYSEVGKSANKGVYVPAKPARRKGTLVKQSNVEDSPEKTCSIPIPTIIVKEPSTSSSGKSSQGSSMEIETQTSDHSGHLKPEDNLNFSSPFAAAIAGAVRDREKRLEAKRNSPAFLSTDMGDEDIGLTPGPRLRHSKSIDEGMFSNEERRSHLLLPSSLHLPRAPSLFNNVDSNSHTEATNARTVNASSAIEITETGTGTTRNYNISGTSNYVHPVTGKVLDPNSPLALALAARDRAMNEPNQQAPSKPEAGKAADLNKPLYIDTKIRPNSDMAFTATSTIARKSARGALRRQETEVKHDSEMLKDERKTEEKKNMLINIVDTSQQKTAGLLMVHTVDGNKADDSNLSESEKEEKKRTSDNASAELKDDNQEAADSSQTSAKLEPSTSFSKAIITVNSFDEPIIVPFRIPPPPLASIDIDEDFLYTEPLPPPLEFANSFDISDDSPTVPSMSDILKQRKNEKFPPLPTFNSSLSMNSVDGRKQMAVSNCLPGPFVPPPENFDSVADSGIEDVDTRSSTEHHLETTSTISTVSSISTLSSEGGENLETCTVYADGQAFLVDKPPVPPKPKMKPILTKNNALHKDALIEETVDNYSIPPPAPPPPPSGTQTNIPIIVQQRTSKLWGDVQEIKSPTSPDPKANVISELNSILQQMNKDRSPKLSDSLDSSLGTRSTAFGTRGTEGLTTISGTRNSSVTFTIRPGNNPPISLQNRTTEFDRTSTTRRAPSPVVSPTETLKEMRSSSLPSSASSPTLSDIFCLPSPQATGELFSLNTGRSRSPSPSALQQSISNKPFTSKPIHLWTKQDVADWLESLNLAEHKEAFMDNEIDGTHLPNLQKEDLIDLGVTRVGHRMNIERALKQILDR
ncbi:SH3 and multiple ankyrin repeat domains protein 2, partial [Protopterus annectens]|uniref:SH3 and multiple ankyrin repeat domains protein 2 n=1 Tax=Protopterus annectens TaxID=7888 RepID=UPI001CF9BA1F